MVKIHTYIISLLENNLERRTNIDKQFSSISLEYSIVDAVVGSLVDKSDDPRLNQGSQHLRAGQIGCSISHIKCYEIAKKEDLDFVLILEDDFKLKMDISIDLSTITNTLKGNSICLLHWGTFPDEALYLDSTSRISLPSGRKMYKLQSGRPLCATAYICTREAYQSLLRNLTPIQTYADDWSRFLEKSFIDNIYIVDPSSVTIRHFESQIGYKKSGGRIRNFLNFIIRNKIPFLNSLSKFYLEHIARNNNERIVI